MCDLFLVVQSTVLLIKKVITNSDINIYRTSFFKNIC